MKVQIVSLFLITVFVSLNSSGCVENTFQLSSDFTPIEKDTFSQINDSDLLVFHICEHQKVNLLDNKYTIRGNITNIGNRQLSPKINATFFMKNGMIPSISNNNVEPFKISGIEPNQTEEFVIEKKYRLLTDIRSYKIHVLY
jgi:hypothetical protein